MSLDITGPIQDLWPNCPVPLLQGIIDTSDDVFAKLEMANNRNRILMFMTEISAETNGGVEIEENMNYSAEGLIRIFGVGHHSAAVTPAEAAALAHHPEQIAERVYGLGNPRKAAELGNDQPGDGWRHRGLGLLQSTGKRLQALVGQFAGIDLAANPQALIAPGTALLCAAADFVCVCRCLPFADAGDLMNVSAMTNVGHPVSDPSAIVGWAGRQEWYGRWARVLS